MTNSTAQLVHATGKDNVVVPPTMGTPREDQLAGSAMENLGEIACRICYDSLGTGRPGRDLHKHIQAAPNLSVYEHCTVTIEVEGWRMRHLPILMNRPGIHVEFGESDLEITANLRAVLEWGNYWNECMDQVLADEYESALYTAFRQQMPNALPNKIWPSLHDKVLAWEHKTDNLNDHQVFISMWLYGSRGFTHEQVRHRFAISQRSTRFTDELPPHWRTDSEVKCEGEYVYHPFLKKWLADEAVESSARIAVKHYMANAKRSDRDAYSFILDELTKYAASHGMDKLAARKQARGAARGVLANALASEMVFTTSVWGWKQILRQRATDLADAEIRNVYMDVYAALLDSPYWDRFDYEIVPATDGLGTILI